jgi:hypothetical protein
MHDWIRFWRVTLVWTAGAMALVLVQYWITAPPGWGSGLEKVPPLLLAIPQMLGLILPVMVYAGGLSVGSTPDDSSASRRWLRNLLIVLTAGAVVFVLIAYASPWIYLSVLRPVMEHVGHPPSGVLTRAELRATYLQHVADAQADPRFSPVGWSGPWSRANIYGLRYHGQGALALLAVAIAWLGMEAGRWTRHTPGLAARTAQRWGPGVALVLWTVVALELGGEITNQFRIPPFITAYGVLVAPTLAILVLVWARWTLRSSRAESMDVRRIGTA